jgi:uncharacterized protein (DUF433 family)
MRSMFSGDRRSIGLVCRRRPSDNQDVTTALDGHIEVDDRGVARIAGTRLKVAHLIIDQMANSSSPEQLREQFPPLTLAQVYAALTYYHDHKDQLDAQIARGVGEADAARAAATDQPTRAGLASRAAGQNSGDAG